MPAKHRSLSWLIFLFIFPTVLLAAGLSWAPMHLEIGAWKKLSVLEKHRSTEKPAKVCMAKSYGQLPMYFIENRGQVDKQVEYYTRGRGHTMFFTKEGIVLTLARPGEAQGNETVRGRKPEAGEWTPPNLENLFQGFDRKLQDLLTPSLALSPGGTQFKELAKGGMREPFAGKRGRIALSDNRQKPAPVTASVVRMQPVGMRKKVKIKALEPQECKVNYFIGNDPKKWRTDIPTFAEVLYEGAYKGIDLKFYGNGQQMEYDIVVKPGADPEQVRFQYAGVDRMEVTPEGDLALHVQGDGVLLQQKPVVYQEIAGQRVPREGKFILHQDQARCSFSFELAAYDKKHPLVIDPVLVYSTYLGGNLSDYAYGIAVDQSGNAYITGETSSPNFPATHYQYIAWRDVFITKLNAAGTSMIYSTFIGGDYDDCGFGIAVDGNGSPYLTGYTTSINFPTSEKPIQTRQSGEDAFVIKLNDTGTALVYSTYLGGLGEDRGHGIAVDGAGNAWVTGETTSFNFPNVNPLSPYPGDTGRRNAFVSKINAAGTALSFSTYLGGKGDDIGWAIALDSGGNAYVTGETTSDNFPLSHALYPYPGDSKNAFVSKIDAKGTNLIFSTYLGGKNGDDYGQGIAVDTSGNVYVTGTTSADDFPVSQALFPSYRGSKDAFVSKLNTVGTVLLYSTYLGGQGWDEGRGIAVDGAGNFVVTGFTSSYDFPLKEPLFPYPGDTDKFNAFVTKINASGTSLVYSTYMGGSSDEAALAVALWGEDNAYVTGGTWSPDFPTQSPRQSTNHGLSDAWVARICRVGRYICLLPVSIRNTCVQGQTAPSQTFEIWNGGNLDLNYTISTPPQAPWISCSPGSGVSSGEHNIITVNYATNYLSPGTRGALITITAPGTPNSPRQIPVTLTVKPPSMPPLLLLLLD